MYQNEQIQLLLNTKVSNDKIKIRIYKHTNFSPYFFFICFRIQIVLAKQKQCSQKKITIVLLNFLINVSKQLNH